MADVASSGVVHWVGTGLSTGRSGLDVVCGTAERVLLWGRTRDKAAGCLDRTGLTGRAEVRGLETDDLATAVRPGDVLVSMLPASEHPALLETCLDRGAHFACTSYTSDDLAAGALAAAAAGLAVLTEAGLDPGIDHLLAHRLVALARAAAGDYAGPVDLASYCGGLPAEPNAFRYKFSWAPLGVLTALGSPARHIEDGAEVRTLYPFEATRPIRIGGADFEVYPNRDSLPFRAQYGVPAGWRLRTFVRGTLRLAGWHAAWQPVFDTVTTGDIDRIAALARELAATYPTGPGDHDRVLLTVTLSVGEWQGGYLLDLTGDGTESAMARCVSLPVAYGVGRILSGQALPGLSRAAGTGEEAEEWLAFLDAHGVRAELAQPQTTVVPSGRREGGS
jgi:saccharopine dehydrogenase (NADP+, L-glutamate forming)